MKNSMLALLPRSTIRKLGSSPGNAAILELLVRETELGQRPIFFRSKCYRERGRSPDRETARVPRALVRGNLRRRGISLRIAWTPGRYPLVPSAWLRFGDRYGRHR